jgi:hypothetical protein
MNMLLNYPKQLTVFVLCLRHKAFLNSRVARTRAPMVRERGRSWFPSRRLDEGSLSRRWLALFPGALAGRTAFESLVFGVGLSGALAGREAVEFGFWLRAGATRPNMTVPHAGILMSRPC